MGLYKELPQELEEVDVIIAGGGTTSCVVAARLADADPGLSILVIEAGPDNYKEPGIVHPGLFFSNMLPTSKNNTFYTSKFSKDLGDRELSVMSPRVLGGGSSINTMAYARPQTSDFDAWDTPGWSTEELRPYLNKFEKYQGEGNIADHGLNGPIHVSEGSHRSVKVMKDFLNVLEKLGWPETKDLHSIHPDAIDRAQKSLRYISKDGQRQDSAHCYLHPRLHDGHHPNLHVLVESEVVSVVIENQTAVGVSYRPNPRFSADSDGQAQNKSVGARKLVVVTCGAFNSPAVLERSGIGNAELLKKVGVPVVRDLPGVGYGYEDHQAINFVYKTNLAPEETVNSVVFGYWDISELIKKNSPFLGSNAQEVGLKMRPREDEVAELGPEFQKAWDLHFKNQTDKPLALMTLFTCFPGYDPQMEKTTEYIGLSNFTSYPFSRGHVHITGASPSDPLDFDAGFFSDPESIDVKKHIWAYKKQREFARRMECYRGEFANWHPPFPATSDAACIETTSPLPADTPAIKYTPEDDAIIEWFIRERIMSLWHGMGTCKMLPLEKNGVVSETLGVHGVKNLKVADLSIAPANVGANTASTAFAIGEKAADMFIRELGL